jgi:hypothetical protein
VNVEEQSLTFLHRNAPLKDARCVSSIQLIVMDEVSLSPAWQAPGLNFVVWYHSESEVLGDWFPPVGCHIPRFQILECD